MVSKYMSVVRGWLQDRKSVALFYLMFGIVCLLNVNYAILRSARNALTVADLGGGAGAIPWFELCGTMPGAILMTIGLTWLLNRYSIYRVFFITLGIFISFFLLFALCIYPLLPSWVLWTKIQFPNHLYVAKYLPIILSMLFFVMAELWKIALLAVLFWGLVNQFIPFEAAKRFYAPLMLGSSIGTILAGPLVSFCTSDWVSGGSWSQSLAIMMCLITAVSVLICGLFVALWKTLISNFPSNFSAQGEQIEERGGLSVWESFMICCRSKYLLLLGWLTIADYIAYALGEVVFLDILKQRYPDPRQYCDFMGQLSFWNGVLAAASAVILTPLLLRKCRWMVASLITPLCLLVTEGAFYFAVWHPTLSKDLALCVFLGSAFFCLVRAAKYTLFDTSKEISFLLLPPLEKMQGKLVIDGMCARLGRGGGSFFSLMLIQLCGGVLASIPIAGGIALGIATSCVIATTKLGIMVEKRSESASGIRKHNITS
jgi:AAA family ATP:ADP antiporter